MREVCYTVASTSTNIIRTRIPIKQVKLQNVPCTRVCKYMRAHVRHFFLQRAGIYRWTIVRARCGVHSEHECNPRAPPFKELDTRNPISPTSQSLETIIRGLIYYSLTLILKALRRAFEDGPVTKIIYGVIRLLGNVCT